MSQHNGDKARENRRRRMRLALRERVRELKAPTGKKTESSAPRKTASKAKTTV